MEGSSSPAYRQAGGAVLDRETLQSYLAADPPLVSGMVEPAEQLQPNGIDVTVRSVAVLTGAGQIGSSSQERLLPGLTELPFDSEGYLHLAPGPYLITFNEVVHLPTELMALGRPRSSLLRSGVALHTAVWDAGYQGRSQSLLVVYHPQGFRIARNARVMQLVFFLLVRPVDEGYRGNYQGENL